MIQIESFEEIIISIPSKRTKQDAPTKLTLEKIMNKTGSVNLFRNFFQLLYIRTYNNNNNIDNNDKNSNDDNKNNIIW